VQVHWVAFEPTPGYLSSYPFAAGIEDGVGASAKELKWEDVQGIPEQKFSQMPLVFTTVATDRADAAVDVRVTENTPDKLALSLQGSAQDEKVSYFVYNGAGYVGSVVKAVATLQMTYGYEVGGWSSCAAEGEKVMGTRTREVKCKGSNGAEYADVFCAGYAPAAEAKCQTTTFFMLAAVTGQCVKVDGVAKKQAKVHYRNECKNNKNKFRVVPTGDDDESFFLQNFQSNLCLGSKYKVTPGGKLWLHDCDGDVNKLTKTTLDDGSVIFKSALKPDFCFKGSGDRLEDIRWQNNGCDKSESAFMLVDSVGEVAVSSYDLSPKPDASASWFLDDGVKLTDEKNSRKWTNPSVQLGVGWGRKSKGVTKATITMNLEEAGPVAAVVLGYNTRASKDVKVPQEVKVMCSKDGSAWGEAVEHSKGDFSKIGTEVQGNTILFNMEKVCTGDEKHVKVEAKSQSKKKMVFDEVDVYRPAKME